jgi:hypothetical protein
MPNLAATPFLAMLPRSRRAVMLDQDMPSEFREELETVGQWAIDNKKDANRDRLAFWILKIPAILGSASAAALAHFKLDNFAMIAARAASACVLIDGLRPRGLLFSAHLRAAHELFKLHAEMISQWRTGRLNGRPPRPLAAEILDKVAPERSRIAIYIARFESSSVYERPPMA